MFRAVNANALSCYWLKKHSTAVHIVCIFLWIFYFKWFCHYNM